MFLWMLLALASWRKDSADRSLVVHQISFVLSLLLFYSFLVLDENTKPGGDV